MAHIKIPEIVSVDTMDEVIQIFGMIPLLHNSIYGWSIQDHSWRMWDGEGPWEWKGPVLRNGNCAYGKFISDMACFVSKEMLPDFVNCRRERYKGYSEDVQALDDMVYQQLSQVDEITSTDLAKMLGFRTSKQKVKKGDLTENNIQKEQPIKIDTVLNRLMREGRVCISDFTYKIDKKGQPYGWGIALYTTVERMFGKLETIDRTPLQSAIRIINRLSEALDLNEGQFKHPLFIKKIQGY